MYHAEEAIDVLDQRMKRMRSAMKGMPERDKYKKSYHELCKAAGDLQTLIWENRGYFA